MDVLGLRAEEARRRLAAAGVTEVEVVETAPPRGRVQGEMRVVRAREDARGTTLVVAAFPRLPDEVR